MTHIAVMFVLSDFSDALSELMTLANLNSKQLAEKLAVEVSAITRYLRAERTPTLNCTADYNLGRKPQ